MDNIINKLNEIGRHFIHKTKFKFDYKPPSTFLGISEVISKARNVKNDNNYFECNVFHWFKDYWLYIRLDFKELQIAIEPSWKKDKKDAYLENIRSNFIEFNSKFYSTSISISVFQGTIEDDIKTQLFRAEWGNYEKKSDKHPQPHWHIYPHKYSSAIHQTFEEFIELGKDDPDFNDVIGQKRIDNKNIIKLQKMHFAMNGQWSENKSDIHSISVESDLINWFRGLLNHLKKELEYVKMK